MSDIDRSRRHGLKTVNSRSLLLPYLLSMMGAMLVVQLMIMLTGGDISVLAGIMLTLVAALGAAAWLWRSYRSLKQIRFGVAIAHAITFAVVTTSFNVHAAVRMVAFSSSPDGFDAAARSLLATPWFGVTLVMSALWGLGLLVHLIGAVLGRGWED
ncbi:hypothetical protein [Paramicrobacterium fandaimingii]|uniref:hypothetical protein n=1 Tax=Paramicrobacterium fandaimingii TaxID=2708079 RepID=UPI00142274CE|nr:hypothetical protein [Microbacterium fandaimingii]